MSDASSTRGQLPLPGFVYDLDARELRRDSGEVVPLRAQSLAVLHRLAASAGRLVTKEELMTTVWRGLVVTDDSLVQCITEVRRALNDVAHDTVRTEKKRGYRLKPLERSGGPSGDLGAPTPSENGLAGGGLSLPDKPSIAVMPFANMSGDPQQEHFTDGITEDIITELSRFRALFVIARNSTFTYKGKGADVRTVARELGVQYVLEGSARRVENRLRITAQLLDGQTARHIWAERYDRLLEDIFEVQEVVTRNIVRAIAPEIDSMERSRARRRPANLSAYEIAMRAASDAEISYRKTDIVLRAKAFQAAREALALDAECVPALVALAYLHWQDAYFGSVADPLAAWREGFEACGRAVEIDPADSRGYVVKGILHCLPPPVRNSPDQQVQYEEALQALRHALDLNANDVGCLHMLGYCEAAAGDPVEGIRYLTQALRNSPRDPWNPVLCSMLSVANFLARNYADGLKWAQRAVRDVPGLFNVHMFLALNYVGLGDIAKAKEALHTARNLGPAVIQARLDGYSPYGREEGRARQVLFLRIAAGLENPVGADGLR